MRAAVGLVAACLTVSAVVAGCGPVTTSGQQLAGRSASGPAPIIPDPLRLSSTGASTGVVSEADRRDFIARFGDSAALAAVDLSSADEIAVGATPRPLAWSTSKVLTVAGLLAKTGGAESLSEDERANIEAALQWSDNDAAALLLLDLTERAGDPAGAAGAMTDLLRRSGDRTTTIDAETSPGEISWAVGDQARFLSTLAKGCLLSGPDTTFLLNSMSQVVDDQRWGLGRVGAQTFKGGWGSDDEGRYVVRQVGLLPVAGGGTVAVAVDARPADDTYETGVAMVDQLAEWASDHLKAAPGPVSC